MTPTYIMPPKPTCKVVKREGERGARIDPKGCKVRTTKDTQGNKRQYNKRGEEKITLKTTGNEMRLVVAGARQHSTVRNWGNRTMRQGRRSGAPARCRAQTVCVRTQEVVAGPARGPKRASNGSERL